MSSILELESEAHEHILGGSSGALGASSTDSPNDRRRRALEAAINRLRRQEEELEQSCGTADLGHGPNADHST